MNGPNQNELPKIADLVEVPEIRTVIQLQDLERPELRLMIMESFVLTAEVTENLKAVFAGLIRGKGRGMFLKGHFGSGKSHFLSVLSLLARQPRSFESIVTQDPSFGEFREEFSARRFLVVDISLVQHRGSEFLEDIVLKAMLGALKDPGEGPLSSADSRKETFHLIRAFLEKQGYSGMLLLVDELSEFLKSKPDARSYNEDIRFLQYLGEEAPSFPLWILASLQEWIEETGEIHQDTFNKIKDRYPVRLNLGRAHIEELVSERLIRKKPGAEEKIREIFSRLRSYFPSFPVTEDRFLRLYPIHPATCSLLDRLKPLFSVHRGVVDFIHFRLKGDPERHIPSSLQWPAQQLIGPETIFDHFLERIRERSETQLYVERVFHYHQEEIPDLFPDQDQRSAALSAVKLLILFALSPARFKYTVRHVAEMVLFRITSLDAEINYRFIHDILERLHKEGSYIRVEEQKDPLDNHYFIDLKADISGVVRKKIRHLGAEIFPEDRRLFTHLATMVDSPYLPLSGWLERGKEDVSVIWQQTRRRGVLYLRQLDGLSTEEMEGLGEKWRSGEEDFFIFVGTTHGWERQFEHVKNQLLPVARSRFPGIFLFWVPVAVGGEQYRLKEILAALLLLEKTANDKAASRTEEQIHFLRDFLDQEKKALSDLFLQAYFEGILLWDENQLELARFGRLTREKFLAEFLQPMLERRFPRHNRIRPYMDAFLTDMLRQMLREFLSTGVMVMNERAKSGLRNVLEGVLKPMGLIRKKGNRYELRIHPRQNELAREFFDEMGEKQRVALEEIYWHFRKGPYGLLMPQFEILVLALLFSGHLVAYRATHRKGPEDLARTGLKGVTALGRGEIIDEAMRKAMADNPLIPEPYLNLPLTLSSQEELWSEIKTWKAGALENLHSLKSRIHWASSFQAFRVFPWEEILNDIDAITFQWEEVKVSLPSKEGLERFIRAGLGDPLLSQKFGRVKAAREFLEKADRVLFIFQYITDPKLTIPDGEAYSDVRESLSGLLDFFNENPGIPSEAVADGLFELFHAFHEAYARAYSDAHHRARGQARFSTYEKVRTSRQYRLFSKLDQLEMISVEHHFRAIEQALRNVLLQRCELAVHDQLQAQPSCTCGFRLGEDLSPLPVADLERDMDRGIRETIEAMGSEPVQERIVPYLSGLELVGKTREAGEIKAFLSLSPEQPDFLDAIEKALNRRVIAGINEAFRGKVVVVERDLDRFYQGLVHRKYTLRQAREFLRRWLEGDGVSEDTYLHFLGMGPTPRQATPEDKFLSLLEARPGPHMGLYREFGAETTTRALITVLWAEQYGIAVKKLIEVLPCIDRGRNEDNREWVTYLAELGKSLRDEASGVLEQWIPRIEEDSSFLRSLWSLIPSFSPAEVFERESIFPQILKEAFERLLADPQEGSSFKELTASQGASGLAGPSIQGLKKDMLEALSMVRDLSENVALLSPPDGTLGPDAYGRWESVYTKRAAFLPLLLSRTKEVLQRMDTPRPPHLNRKQKEIIRKLQDLSSKFASFYKDHFPSYQGTTGNRPTLIQDIPGFFKKKRDVPDYREIRYVLMDGMRMDLWEVAKTEFFGKMPQHFRIVREGVLWAHAPTNTSPQLERLEEALRKTYPEKDPGEMLIKATGIDERLHIEKGPLPELFAGVLRFLQNDLLFTLKRLPQGTLLVLFADHGFEENPAFEPSMKYDFSRYTHGGLSPFEVIVPWAWVMKI